MQADVELGFTIERFTAVASFGFYHGEDDYNARRAYLMLRANDNINVRVGRFYPNYGIIMDDHRLINRSGIGFNQNGETYNLEIMFSRERGEIFVTALSKNKSIRLIEKEGPIPYDETERGVAIKSSHFLGKRSQIGFSGMFLQKPENDELKSKVYAGAYSIFGWTKNLYTMFDGSIVSENDELKYIGFSRVGMQINRGIQIRGTYEYIDQGSYRIGGGLQIFPRPHWEILAEFSKYETPVEIYDTFTAMIHYYF